MIVTNANTVPAIATASGTQIRVLLDTTGEGQGRMSLAMETLKPGQQVAPHWHTHLEEIYYILKGQGRMEIGDEAREVGIGDVILIPVNETHCLYNTGDDDLVLLCTVSPPWYPEDSHPVEEGER
ncbi:MAG: cupin domain-containing protein [Chloroflexi bacterium]|nr:cupin domain-containing protein [Chloroflexota bacterium]